LSSLTPTLLEVAVLCLGAFRLTRLVTTDDILSPLRDRLWRRFPPSTRLGYVVTCNWCTSVWVSVVLVVAYSIAPNTTTYVSAPLALSAVVGILAALTRE
jgi:hypothetical protein